MKQNGHARYYDKLSPEERFRLDVLAKARGDEKESELLERTCQRATYTMKHLGFTDRWDGILEITLRMYIGVNNQLSKLQMIDAFREVLPYLKTLSHNTASDAYFTGHRSGSFHAWKAAGKTEHPPAWPDPEMDPEEDEEDPAMDGDMEELHLAGEKDGAFLPGMLEKLEWEVARDALSLWERFCRLCEERVGVPAEKVVAVVLAPVADRIEELQHRAQGLELEPDTETVEQIREGLAEKWRTLAR